jgi:hypothetical protein
MGRIILYSIGMKIGKLFDRVAGAKMPRAAGKKHESGETMSVRVPQTPQPKRLSLTGTALAVAVIGASFYLGVAYQKSQTAAQTLSTNGSNSAAQSQNGGLGNGLNGGYGRFGRAGMSTSITAKDSSGSSATYAITGDSVIIIPEHSDSTTARRIIVNPDFDQNSNQPVTIDPDQTQVN